MRVVLAFKVGIDVILFAQGCVDIFSRTRMLIWVQGREDSGSFDLVTCNLRFERVFSSANQSLYRLWL